MATIAPNTPSSPTPQGGSEVATNVPESRRRSGAFTNLQSYIRANRDTTSEQADKVAQDIEKRGQQALSDIQSEAQRATQEIQSVGPQIEESDVQSQFDLFKPGQQPDPTAGNNFEQARQTITQLRDANPNQVQFDFSDAANRARSAERDARMLGTTEGLQSLLRKGQRPETTRGENRLDTLLLQSIPESRQRFSGVQQGLIGATDPALEQNTASVNQAIQDRQARLAALRQFADAQLAQEIDEAYGILDQRRPELAQQVRDRSSQLSNQYSDVLNQYLSGAGQNLSPTFGTLDPTRFLQGAGRKTPEQLLLEAAGDPLSRVQNLGAGELLNADEVARLNALYSLRGDLGQAGENFTAQQYTATPTGIDDLMFQGQIPNINSRLQSETAAATSAFNSDINNAASSYISAIQDKADTDDAISRFIDGSGSPIANAEWNEIKQRFGALEQNLPKINQALQKYGFNSLGNNITEALRKFGYTGPARSNIDGYFNANDPQLLGGAYNRGGDPTAMKSLMRAFEALDNAVLSTSVQSGSLPDVYVPPAPAPSGQEPAGTLIDYIPGFGGGRVLTSG